MANIPFLNNAYFAGKVGIGTEAPSANLDIEDADGVTIDINSSSGDGQFRFQDNGVTKWSVGRDNTQQNFVFSSSTGLSSDNVLTLDHSTGDATFASDVTLANGNSLRWTSDDVRIEGTTAGDNIKFYVANTEILQLAQSGTLATVTGDLRVTGAYYDSGNLPGTTTQVLSSTATGTSWVDQSTLVSGSAERVSILVKNGEGTALVKGDPVYIIGSVGASARLEVGLCDASDTSKMPCVGLLEQNLLNNGEGTAVTAGKLRNLVTTPIDGQTTTENDTIYVKAGGSSGSSLTTTKPTGSTNLIQNVGQVGRVSTSSDGNFVVSAIMRTNDVPNLPEGRIWIGDGNTIVSDTVYIDEPNLRLGIGTTSPGTALHVVSGGIGVQGTSGASALTAPGIWMGSDGTNALVYGRQSSTWKPTYLDSSALYINAQSGGNVGIGTASPGTINSVAFSGVGLHVKSGTLGRTITEGSSEASYLLNNSGASANQRIKYIQSTAGNLAIGSFDDNGLARPQITVLNSGDVGIGATPTTGYKLDVVKTSPGYSIVGSHVSGGKVGIYSSTGDNGIGTINNYNFNLFTNNSAPQVTLTTAGSVGIGNTAPIFYSGYSSITLGGTYGSTGGLIKFGTATSNDGPEIFTNATKDLHFNKAGSGTNMVLYAAGAVRFNNYNSTNNTGTPTYLLGTDASGNIVKTNTVPGSAAGPYLPLAGGTMTGTNGVLMPDNFKLKFGDATTPDLEIYHDGSNSYIQDTGTGTLNLQGSTQVLIGGTNGEVGVQYVENAGVGLRHNNVTKLTTESTGINVVGDIKIDSALLSNQENTDIDTGTETVANVAIATYTAAFFDFVIKKTTNVRSGTVYACHDGTNVEFTETSTQDLGDTSDVTLSVDISGGNMRLRATTTSDDWSIKSLIRAI